MQDLGGAVGILVELVDRSTLGAEGALVVGAAGIAFDVHDFAVDRVHDRGTTTRAQQKLTA